MLSSAVMERKQAIAWMSQQPDGRPPLKMHRGMVADELSAHVSRNGRYTSAVENIVIPSVAACSRNEFRGEAEERSYEEETCDRVNAASYSIFRDESENFPTPGTRVARVDRPRRQAARPSGDVKKRGRWLSIGKKRESRYRSKRR